MPAVTLQKSTSHSSQNCGVLIAFAADTASVVTSASAAHRATGRSPAGIQSSAGTLTSQAPNSMTTR